MKTLLRYAATLFAASLLALGLGAGTELPNSPVAEAQFGVNWGVNSVSTDMQLSGTGGVSENTSSDSEQTSSDGQSLSDHQSKTKNSDGTSSEEEDVTYDDGKCQKGGGFNRHTTIDKNGNRKVHTQETWRENGKCEIRITDELYDKNNHLVSKTPPKIFPCSQYRLEMSFDGGASLGFAEAEWGPHKAVIPLTDDNGTYRGSYDGQFNGTVVGECNAFAVYPVSAEVTAVEDEFQDLDFTVKLTMSMQLTMSCPDYSGSTTMPAPTGTKTFTLPSKDGSSYVLATPGNEVRYTFTLRKQCGAE